MAQVIVLYMKRPVKPVVLDVSMHAGSLVPLTLVNAGSLVPHAPSTVLRLTPVSLQPSPARLTATALSTVMASTHVRMPE